MPLVRIDLNQGRAGEDLRLPSQAIPDAFLAEYGIPERGYFHVLTEHPRGQTLRRTRAWDLKAPRMWS